jgi:hypothetical protein
MSEMGGRLVVWAVVGLAVGCGGSASSDTCASGTHLEHGQCVVTVDCGPGTMLVAGACLPGDGSAGAIGSGVQCGLGTELVGQECLPARGGGGSGSAGRSGASGADAGAFGEAGERGMAESGSAGEGSEPVALSCGAGTIQVGNVCLPDDNGSNPEPEDGGIPSYIVRVGVTSVGADGYSAVPVFVIGTNPNYEAANDSVVLGLERPGAGALSITALKPGPSGTTLYFTPCSTANNAFCAGAQRVTLASASAPTLVIAQSQEFTLVAPTGVGSDSPCLAGGNVLFFNGDAGSYIYSGIETVTLGAWSGTATSSQVHISVDPTDSGQGLWWDLYFDASKLQNPVLQAQVYEGAERWPFQDSGHPGLDVSGDGRGCNTVSGRFEIQDLKVSNGTLQSFTATFEHHCEGAAPALRGCVHYGQ